MGLQASTLLCVLMLLPSFVFAAEMTATTFLRDPYGQIHADGDVTLKTNDFSIQAESMTLDMDAKTGTMQQASVRFDDGHFFSGDMLERTDVNHFRGENITYTTCPDDDRAWRIVAEDASLDKEEGTFIAHNAWFEWGGVPVLYTPRWENALTRRSGFLMPALSQSSRRGISLQVPYFWDAARNWDATFSPNFMSLRGTMADVQWRHRSVVGNEMIRIQTIQDKQTNAQRSRIMSDTAWRFGANLDANVHIDAADDGLFAADFPMAGDIDSAAFLTSTATLNWRQDTDSAMLTARYQQVLGGGSNAATLQILPRLQTRNYFDVGAAENVKLEHQTTVFDRESGVSGTRIGIRPSWSVPWAMQNGAVAIEWSLLGQYVDYESQQFSTSHAHYGAVATSVEASVAFERISDNHQWRHEIKPIVRLDLSSAGDQGLLPSYDSSLLPLNFSNILQGNRYSGWDRFERMSRMSVLLDSTLQSKDGVAASRTILQGQIGLAWDSLQESVDLALTPAADRRVSNLLAEMAWMPSESLRLSSGGQRDPDLRQWVESHVALRWQGQEKQYLDVSWQKTDASYSAEAETINMVGKVAINQRWASHVVSQYDLYRKHLLHTKLGLDYVHPCWNMTAEAFKTFQVGSSNSLTDIGVRLLLAFDGLGSLGE